MYLYQKGALEETCLSIFGITFRMWVQKSRPKIRRNSETSVAVLNILTLANERLISPFVPKYKHRCTP